VLFVAGAGVGTAGGVHGWTVVVAAIVVVVVVTISGVIGCCSWRKVAMLERCVFGDGCPGGSIRSVGSLVGDVGRMLISVLIGSAFRCMGSSSLLELGDLGLGKTGSSSEDSIVASCSDGRLSPSKSWMSALATPRYGLPEAESCSNSCQRPPYKVTALVFFADFGGGLNRRMSYPHLFLWSSADTKVIRSFVLCADFNLLRATCVSSSQTCVLLVSLELAMIEKE
jgi:hypothetical protein